MAAITSISLTDAKATPVVHVFQPAKSTADYSMYEDRSGGIYIGYGKLHISMTRPKGASNVGNRNIKVSIALEMPVLETLGNNSQGLTPPPTVAYRVMGKADLTIPDRCTLQERKDIRKMLTTAFDQAPIFDAIDNLSMPW